MKHYLLSAIIMALSFVPSIAQEQSYDFSAVNDDGITIYYNIISEEEKTCEVITGWWWEGETYVEIFYSGDIVLPSTANGYKVTGISEGAFSYSDITSITISNTVTTIGKWAFYSCTKLKYVNIGDGVETIGVDAFYNCNALETLIVGKSVKTVYDGVFNSCTNLSNLELNTQFIHRVYCGLPIKKVTLGDNVKEISEGAFFMCSLLTTVNISNSVTVIKDNAFEYCSSLSTIEIPNSVTSIGNNAFKDCGLSSIEIPNSVTSIGNDAFYGCSSLGCLTIPNSVTDIGYGAFQNCSSLDSVTIPNSVTHIGDDAFSGCSITNLFIDMTEIGDFFNNKKGERYVTNVTFGESVKIIGDYAFFRSSFLESIDIKGSITSIGDYAFTLTNIKSINLPESLTSIGDTAFADCMYLSSITIPKSVRYIGDAAFGCCEALSTVTSYITDVFDIPENVFEHCGNNILYVPYGLAETYRATPGWNVFENIIEMDPASVPMQIACSAKGSVTINNRTEFTKGIGTTNIFENADNTFTFTPNPGCRIDQVILNGLDITSNVEGNTLTCTVPANSQMLVTFTSEPGDINNDGRIDISDVVAIVNKILSIQ